MPSPEACLLLKSAVNTQAQKASGTTFKESLMGNASPGLLTASGLDEPASSAVTRRCAAADRPGQQERPHSVRAARGRRRRHGGLQLRRAGVRAPALDTRCLNPGCRPGVPAAAGT